MWPIDTFFLNSNPLASSHQNHLFLSFFQLIYNLDRHRDSLCFDFVSQFVLSCKKPDNPTCDKFSRLIGSFEWLVPLMIDIVPKQNIWVAFKGLDKLINYWKESIDILLQSALNIELLQKFSFLHNLLPILQITTHMNVLNAANAHLSFIVEVFLVGIHNCGSWHNLIETISSGEVTQQVVRNCLRCLFFDFYNHLLEERAPVVLVVVCSDS